MNRRDFLSSLVISVSGVPFAAARTSEATPSTLDMGPKDYVYSGTFAGVANELREAYLRFVEDYGLESNDGLTRQHLVCTLDNVLLRHKQDRKIYHWQIICDDSNNPPNVVDSGVLAVDVIWKPAGIPTLKHFKVRPPLFSLTPKD